MRIKIGYPSLDQEVSIMEMQSKEHPIHSLSPVSTQEQLIAMQEAVKNIQIERSVKTYIASLVEATRKTCARDARREPTGFSGSP